MPVIQKLNITLKPEEKLQVDLISCVSMHRHEGIKIAAAAFLMQTDRL